MDRASEAIIKTEDLDLRVRELERKSVDGGSSASLPLLFLTAPKIYIGTSSFGNIKTNGKVLAIVTFSGDSTTLRFKGVKVVTGASPLIAVIDGQGKLDLSNNRDGSQAVIIGDCTVV